MTINHSTEIEANIECDECGNDLTSKIRYGKGTDITLYIEPCDKCLEEARKAGGE